MFVQNTNEHTYISIEVYKYISIYSTLSKLTFGLLDKGS